MRNSCTSQGVVYGIFAFSSFLFDSSFDGCATGRNRRKLFEIKLTCRFFFSVFLTLKRFPLERHLYYNAFLVQMSCMPVASETKSWLCLFYICCCCCCCCLVHKKASKLHDSSLKVKPDAAKQATSTGSRPLKMAGHLPRLFGGKCAWVLRHEAFSASLFLPQSYSLSLATNRF